MSEQQEKRLKENKRNKVLRTVVIALAALLLIGVAGVVTAEIYFNYLYQKTNYVTDPESIEYNSEAMTEETTMDPAEVSRIAEELAAEESRRKEQEELSRAEEEMGKLSPTESADVASEGEVVHIMLIGVDRRTATWNGNSDTMVLCSINRKKKKIVLTSFMRDTAVTIPGVAGVRKLNAAFAIGNGPLLMQTMQANFQVPVTYYAWVDFDSMTRIIDLIGGVDIFLTVAEAKHIGITITTPQVVHLNGEQATHHSRDRKSGGNDYMRTQRQRNVLMAIANKAKSGTLGDLSMIAEELLPLITHNIDQQKLRTIIGDFMQISSYTIEEQRIPYDGLYRSVNGNLVPNYEETIRRFRAFVY